LQPATGRSDAVRPEGVDSGLHMLALFHAPGAQPPPGAQLVALAQGLVVELARVARNGVAVFIPLEGIIGIVEPDHAPRRLSAFEWGRLLHPGPDYFIIVKKCRLCKSSSEGGRAMEAEQNQLVFETVALAGEILVSSGAEIFRVTETMERIAAAYGCEGFEPFVL